MLTDVKLMYQVVYWQVATPMQTDVIRCKTGVSSGILARGVNRCKPMYQVVHWHVQKPMQTDVNRCKTNVSRGILASGKNRCETM